MKTTTLSKKRKRAGAAGGKAGTGQSKVRKKFYAASANGGSTRQREIDRKTSREAGSVAGFESCTINTAQMIRHCNDFFRRKKMPVNEYGFANTIHVSAQHGLKRKARRRADREEVEG